MAHGSQQHLTCSFIPACLRCRILVDTNVPTLCTSLLCAGPIEGCSAVLAVRRYCCDFRSLVCAFVVFRRRKAGSKTKASLFVLLGGHMASRADDTACFVSKSISPAVMFTSRLVLPSAMTWTEKSACVANLPRSRKHTRAPPAACCCYGVAVLRLVLVLLLLQLPITLSSPVTCNEKTKEKTRRKGKI